MGGREEPVRGIRLTVNRACEKTRSADERMEISAVREGSGW